MHGLQSELGIQHAIPCLLDEQRQGLFTLDSCGYADSGVAAEMSLADAGLTGVAVREEAPIRIGHMTQAYRYDMAWRGQAQALGLDAVIGREMLLPGLQQPRSQLAMPLRARGRTVGAVLVESDRHPFFSDDDDVPTLLVAQLAQALAALQAAELEAGLPVPAAPAAAVAAAAPPNAAAAPPLRVRHCGRDGSVFVDDAYLIKGVAGAILSKLMQEVQQCGRSEVTTRELRLAGGDLRLPEVQDKLGVRLLLERRLAERDCSLAIERSGRGRGRFRLRVARLLELLSGE